MKFAVRVIEPHETYTNLGRDLPHFSGPTSHATVYVEADIIKIGTNSMAGAGCLILIKAKQGSHEEQTVAVFSPGFWCYWTIVEQPHMPEDRSKAKSHKNQERVQ
jgi:hypothetical protein